MSMSEVRQIRNPQNLEQRRLAALMNCLKSRVSGLRLTITVQQVL